MTYNKHLKMLNCNYSTLIVIFNLFISTQHKAFLRYKTIYIFKKNITIFFLA